MGARFPPYSFQIEACECQNREHDLIKRRKLEEEDFEKLSISKAITNIIIALGE